tara:strand:- start:1269 stop:1490 length:222 start_codon:yes stop_codon:yes gene_type:complete
MVTVNPWLLILSFVYFFVTGFLSYQFSIRTVNYFLEKTSGGKLSRAEPIIGIGSFVVSYGLSLYILYIFLNSV